MTSEASSTTTNARKRKLVDSEADEVFILQKKQDLTLTKTVSISIPEMLEKINDENNKKNSIKTPVFKLGNLDFYLEVIPEQKEGYTGLTIYNFNKVEVMMSMEIKEKPFLTEKQWPVSSRKTLKAGHGTGWQLSYDAYREWASENEDVFKITAVVTLHIQEGSTAGEEWTTLR